MTQPARLVDRWRVPNLLLWLVFFAIGLVPSTTFEFLREIGRVNLFDALIGSPWALTLGLVAYFAAFTYRQCRDAGLTSGQTSGHTLQLAILAGVAFSPVESLFLHPALGEPVYLRLVLAIGLSKGVLWLYLLSVVVRVCLLSGGQVFVRMPSIFPSTHRIDAPEEDAAERQVKQSIEPQSNAPPEKAPSDAGDRS